MRKKLIIGILCILIGVFPAFAQQKVSGTVTDARGDALAGVSIVEKGASNGATTDADGKFTITVSQGSVLQISYIGYVAQEITVGNRTQLQITMEEDLLMLDEVVVVGFAVQKKVNLTGAVGTIDSKAFKDVPVQNAVQALQGQIPGLLISQNDGRLNTKAGISIRGLSTIGQGSSGSALILIDGVEGDLHSINPQDIENISVLKDVAASSIYGSRAPFGVILVTTKKGKQGKVVVNYSNSFRYSMPLNMMKASDSFTWANYVNESSHAVGWGDVIGPEQMQRIKDYMDGKITATTIAKDNGQWSNGYELSNDNIDYFDVIYKDVTKSQEHNLSVQGGSERTNYYISANYLDDGGKMNWGSDGLKRYNVFGKFEASLSPFVRINSTSRFIRTDFHQPVKIDGTGFFDWIGKQTWPIYPLYDPNGFLFDDHILGLETGGVMKNQVSMLIQQVGITVEPLKGWHISGNLDYKYTSNFNHKDWKTYTQKAVDGIHDGESWYNNTVNETADKADYFNINLFSDYEKTFADKHYVKVLAGFQAENNNYRNLSASRDGMIVFDIPTLNTTTGLGQSGNVVPPVVSGGYSSWATAGFFGRLNYNYMEKYLFEANLRYDGSSRFRRDNRWGLFPAFSLGYNVAKEDFFQPLASIINTLKLRASYGSLGNQNTTSLYPTYQTMNYSMNSGAWLIDGTKPNNSWPPSLISTSLTWEEIQSNNIGLDFAFFNQRLTGSFDCFVRKTLNMVGPADELPVILGTSVPVTNNTDLETKGFELELMWRDRIMNDLHYSLRFVLSDAQTEITRYSNPSGTLSKYYTGMKTGEIWGYETIGIAKTQEEMDAHLATLPNGGQSNLGANWQAGDVMYRDINGDGKIDGGAGTLEDHGDKKIIGNVSPRYNFGFDITADWKGFDFRLFLQGTGKRDYFQGSRYFFGCYWNRWESMMLTQHEDYFRDDPNHHLGLNLDSYYPRPIWETDKNMQCQSRWVQNVAYMRLKNIQIGYTLPVIITNKIGISKLRIYLSGENLATCNNMSKLFDPETIDANGTGNAYPLSKTYAFGINLTF